MISSRRIAPQAGIDDSSMQLAKQISRRRFMAGLAAGIVSPAVLRASVQGEQFNHEIFSNVSNAAGITWKHFSGASPDRLLIETMGGGVGFIDSNGDGLLDIFLVNGGETPNGKSKAPVRNALYRNLGNGKFKDVSREAGFSDSNFYGMGVSIADYDNDGHQDIFVTGYPRCALFHNNGDGTFSDVSRVAGIENTGRWAASAAWFDYDRDGLLDLIVCNYVRFSFTGRQPDCEYDGVRTYCEQRGYEGMPLTLYHNNGNGTFTDVSEASGVAQYIGRALGVVAIDIDDNGWTDLIVTRDGSPNLLLINKGDGTFEDAGLAAEIAYDSSGNTRAGMGVDVGDINGDGYPDIVVTNFNFEYHSIFLGAKTLPFTNWTRESHVAMNTRLNVGWGAHFLDYDNDGSLDLMIVNGHINEVVEKAQNGVKYKEQPLLLCNTGKGVFENAVENAGEAFRASYTARGLAIGDFDNDGGTDAIFTCIGESPVLLHNNVASAKPWIGMELVGTKSNRDAIGSKVTMRGSEGKTVRWITSGSSYLSSHDKRIIFGLGSQFHGDSVEFEIRWPSGASQIVRGLKIRRYHKVTEP